MIKQNLIITSFFALFTFNDICQSQDPDLPPATGERPDFTAGPDTVPSGHLQLETGFTRSFEHNENAFNVGGLLRYGLTENFEARVNMPVYIRDNAADGFTDSGIGTKWNFLEEEQGLQPGISLISGITLPTGKDIYRSDSPELNLSLELGKDLTDDLGVNANLVNTGGDEWGSAVSFGYDLCSYVGTYVELFRVSPKDNWIDGGFTFRIDNDTVFDITMGKQLSGSGEDSYWGFGLVKRW